MGASGLVYGIGAVKQEKIGSLPVIGIRSNGNISASDELLLTDPIKIANTGHNVKHSTLTELLSYPIFEELNQAQKILPNECINCCWGNVCGGGSLVNRFSHSKRFNNPSIYCEGLKDFFAHLTYKLLNVGVPLKKIQNVLFQ